MDCKLHRSVSEIAKLPPGAFSIFAVIDKEGVMWIRYFEEAFDFWFLVWVMYASGAMYQPKQAVLPAQADTNLANVENSKSASFQAAA